MRSKSKKLPVLAYAALVLALCLIGLVAKATLAQDPAKEPVLVPGAELLSLPAPALAQDLDVPKVDPVAPVSDSLAALPGPGPAVLERTCNAPEDPENAAMAFVTQNLKLAEARLVELRAEEARLRGRLQKVDSGIKRWEKLVDALKTSQGNLPGAPVSPVPPDSPVAGVRWKQGPRGPYPDEPDHLEPVSSEPKPPAVSKK